MDFGVWMAHSTWEKKAHSPHRCETWSLRALPEGFGADAGGASRMFVAVRGQWRGYFVLQSWSWNPHDTDAPIAMIFDPHTWTPITPLPAPARPPQQDFTLAVPSQTQHRDNSGTT